ncbi:MAG: NosD domain-containing protein [Promethearchaeia archaeon]
MKKFEKLFPILFFFCMTFSSVFPLLGGNFIRLAPSENLTDDSPTSPTTSEVISPISIDGNDQLNESSYTTGNGTYDDPYVIEDYVINASDAHGIYIRNTDAYLIIRNCTVENGSANSNNGMHFYNCKNVNIMNNTLMINAYGILLSSSSNNMISSNVCFNNSGSGIYLVGSSCNNSIVRNNCSKNEDDPGIELCSSSNNNEIINNTCSENDWGISLDSSINNTISWNNCSNNSYAGIGLVSSSNNTIFRNNCSHNDLNGIILDSAINNTVLGNNCSYNGDGLHLDSSNNNTILGNNCSNNGDDGIHLSSSNGTLISGNNCSNNNVYGIFLYSPSFYNTISANNCSKNRYGVGLDG